jgi:hypothetical protein
LFDLLIFFHLYADDIHIYFPIHCNSDIKDIVI